MKVLKQILFAAVVMMCFSLTASAQRQDGKKIPPKETPPKIVVPPDKYPDKDKPKENDRPKTDKKKPESAFFQSFDEKTASVA